MSWSWSSAPPGSRQRRCRCVFGIAVALLATFSPCFAQEWQIECVHCPKYFDRMTDRSLQLDSLGRPHVAYGGDHLYYSRWDGTAWIHETVDDEPSVGERAALAFDPSGSPHICYVDTKTGAIRHAYRGDSGWEVEVVVESGYSFYEELGFAISSQGTLHLCFVESHTILKHAWKDGASWVFETADDSGYSYVNGLSLAVGDSEDVAIGYVRGTNLRCARRNPGSWVTCYIDEPSCNPSVCFGGSGEIHLSYGYYNAWPSTQTRDLRYARVRPEGATIETVDASSGVGQHSSVAVSEMADIYIAYRDQSDGDLMCARRLVSGWFSDAIDSETDTGSYPSMAVDPWGGLHFAHLQEGPMMALRYCLADLNGYHRETICAGGGTFADAGDIAVAVDDQAHVHMSWVEGYYSWRSEFYGRRSENGWSTEVVRTEHYGLARSSISIGIDAVPHIGYVTESETGSRLVEHAWKDGEEWMSEVAAGESYAWVHRLSLAVDSENRPHACYDRYYSEPQGIFGYVRYAHEGDAGWEITTVDGSDAFMPSFALDTAGHPHVVYEGINYARIDSAGWEFETLAQGDDPCIALDQAGGPYVTYARGGMVWFCWKDESTWRYEAVDARSISNAAYAPLGIDSYGRAHIAYQGPDGSLRYAVRSSSGWQIETVDAGHHLAERLSLALGPDGSVHIGYSDDDNRDVKYAYRQPLGSDTPDWPNAFDLTLRIEGPCPSAGMTPFGLFLAEPSPVNLSVFDLGGRRVRMVAASPLPGGTHRLIWDGLDDRGFRVPSGTYICAAEADGARATTRVVIIR